MRRPRAATGRIGWAAARAAVWLAAVLLMSQRTWAGPESPSPSILSYRIGPGFRMLTGRAAGWPYRPGQWNWLTVTVSNPLERPMHASLVFRTVESPTGARFNLRKPFALPASADLQVSFPVPIAAVAGPSGRQAAVELELVCNGSGVDKRRASANPITEQLHVMAILGQAGDLGHLMQEQVLYPQRGPQLQARSTIRVLPAFPDQMPDDPLGYDLIDTLVLAAPVRLRPSQWAALDRWVQAGGCLIVVLAEGFQQRSQPDLDALLPVLLVGSHRVTVLECLSGWSGKPLRAQRPVQVWEAVVRSGRVLLRDGDNPLLVARRYGLGTVGYVGVGPGAARWSPAACRAMWIRLLEQLGRPAAVDLARLRLQARSILNGLAGREAIGLWLPLLLLSCYAAAIGGLLWLAGRRGRPEWAWLWVWGVAFVFAGGGCLAASMLSGRQADEWFELWVGCGASPSRLLRVNGHVGLLPGRRGRQRFTVSPSGVRVMPSQQGDSSVINASMEPDRTAVDYHAQKGRLRLFQLDGYLELAGLEASGRAGPNGLKFELLNRSGLDLQATALKFGRRIVPVGQLSRGQRSSVTVGPADGPTPLQRYELPGVLTAAARRRRAVLDALFVDPFRQKSSEPVIRLPRGMRQGTASQTLLIGWVDQPVVGLAGDGQGRPGGAVAAPADSGAPGAVGHVRRSLGLLAVVPRMAPASDRFLVPKGGMTMELLQPTVGQLYYGQSVFAGAGPVTGSALTMRFTVPEWARPARLERAWLFVDFQSEAFGLSVFVGQRRLDLAAAPQGKFEVPLDRQQAEEGVVPLRLVITPRGRFARRSAWQGHRWMVREVDVEGLCRRRPTPGGAPPAEGRPSGEGIP